MSLTVAYMTSRKDPKIEWFASTLAREIDNSKFAPSEIIIVDFYADEPERREFIQSKLHPWTALAPKIWHITPKPTIWQGAHRKTKNQYFAASNARNTAFARCTSDFIACTDDLSAFVPGWLDQVRHAMEHQYVALGAYKKVFKLAVSPQGDITFEENDRGVDSRWSRGGNGIMPARGTDLFGCSFAMPLNFALAVNGFDEICDSVSMEDVEFGARLERAGFQFHYNRNMLTYESEELHHIDGNQCFIRNDRKTKMGLNADWWILEKRVRSSETWTCGNDFDLRELRSKVLSGEPFPIPTKEIDWATEQPLVDM